jgi:hypothetical protein
LEGGISESQQAARPRLSTTFQYSRLFYFTVVQIKLSKHHHTDIELCYKKQHKECLLYDDTIQPRQLIATISGDDFDGWQWRAECEKLSNYWQQVSHFKIWRAAMMDAASAYIN